MTQTERLNYLISALIREFPRYKDIEIPSNTADQKRILRSLFNVRPAKPIDSEFLKIQDEYLKEEIRNNGITELESLTPINDNLYLWQGDITTLKVDAIVNAANSGMLGCFEPCHSCIDNAIHTYAGIQLRLACNDFMKQQGKPEATGTAKITPAYNLLSKYVLHTVGPIVGERLTQTDCDLLASCYRSCLELAEKQKIKSMAFCCISTGVFHFPNEKAAEIAVAVVTDFLKKHSMKIVFNVFKDTDRSIYHELLK